LEKLGLNLGYLIVQILNFGIVFLVLYEWAYKPILAMMEKRKNITAQGLEDARIASEARANAEQEAARIISEAQVKASAVIREATDRAELAGKEVKAASEGEIAKARETAMQEIEGERTRILSELRGQVAALAIAAAQKLVGESLDEKRQHTLLQEFFSGVKNGKVVVLEGAEVSGMAAEVTSALPLTEDEKGTVKKELMANMGASAEVTFRVDPAILGGLIVRMGDRLVDGSVSGQLQAMRTSLQ